MAVKFFSGFETGDFSEWTNSGPTISTASPNSGNYTGTGALNTPTALNLATCCAKMSFRIIAAPPPMSQTAQDCLELVTTTTNVLAIALVSNTDGTYALRLIDGTAGGIGSSTIGSDYAVSAGQWITVEAKRVASTQALEMRVNGTVRASGTGTQGTANVDHVTVSGSVGADLDDIVVDDANYPGNAKVIARQAAASQAPTYDTFTKSTGGNIGTVWNDTPFNATTNANKATTGGAQTMNVFSFGSAQTGHGSEVIAAGDTILGAKVAVIEKTSATSSGGTLSSIRYRIAGADVDKAITLTASDKYFESAIFVDTLANLNAMQVGVLKGSTTRTHTVEDAWAMVVYRPTIAPVSGTATSSQASQTQADAGKETVKGTATASQTAQSEAAAGTVTAATHITGTATSAQAGQSEALAAKETIRATATEAQAAQTEAVAGKETIRATATESQATQTETIAAKEKFTGTATESQAAQTEAIAAAEKFVGSETSAQSAQAESLAGKETISGTETSVQASQTESAAGKETLSATATSTQAAQGEAIAAREIIAATETSAQAQQDQVASGKETIPATLASAQQAQAESAAGTETVSASAASAQARQSEAVVAVETITATAASNQAQQEETANDQRTITGTAVQAQAAQQEDAAGTETLTGSITAAQAPQTLAAIGTLHISGAIAQVQAPQSTIASSAGAISGTVESVQASQLQLVSGTVVVPVVPTTAGGGWNVPLTVRQPAKRPMVIAGYAVQQQAKQAQSALGSYTFVMKNPTDDELLLLLLGGVA